MYTPFLVLSDAQVNYPNVPSDGNRIAYPGQYQSALQVPYPGPEYPSYNMQGMGTALPTTSQQNYITGGMMPPNQIPSPGPQVTGGAVTPRLHGPTSQMLSQMVPNQPQASPMTDQSVRPHLPAGSSATEAQLICLGGIVAFLHPTSRYHQLHLSKTDPLARSMALGSEAGSLL
uniref:Uncharacterized protein n=1 Tax=Strigamia maritima TaxID=126957 RepID=T1IJF1_STRMM